MKRQFKMIGVFRHRCQRTATQPRPTHNTRCETELVQMFLPSQQAGANRCLEEQLKEAASRGCHRFRETTRLGEFVRWESRAESYFVKEI